MGRKQDVKKVNGKLYTAGYGVPKAKLHPSSSYKQQASLCLPCLTIYIERTTIRARQLLINALTLRSALSSYYTDKNKWKKAVV